MDNKLFKVRIKKSSGERYWYADQIGEVFEVVDIGHKGDYTVSEDYLLGENAGWRHIQKDDCEIIPASLSQPSKDVESAAKELVNALPSNQGPMNDVYIEWGDVYALVSRILTSHQPQCQMRWRSGKDLPPIDDSDFPRKYVCRFKGDDPRSGWVDVALMTAAEMREENYDDYWEWLDESLSSSPAEDKVQILVEAAKNLSQVLVKGEYGHDHSIWDAATQLDEALNKFKTP